MRIAIIIGTLLLAANCFAMGHSTVMLAMVSGPSAPSAVTGLSASNSPAQITVNWSAATGASTYDVYYALSSSASIIPANNDCTYLLETSYTSGLTSYPGTPNATAGVYTGVSGTSYTINGPLTSGSSYCVAVSGVNSGMVQGTLSGTTHAAAAAAVDTGASGWTINTFAGNGDLGYTGGNPLPLTYSDSGVNNGAQALIKKTLNLIGGTTITWSGSMTNGDEYFGGSLLFINPTLDSNGVPTSAPTADGSVYDSNTTGSYVVPSSLSGAVVMFLVSASDSGDIGSTVTLSTISVPHN